MKCIIFVAVFIFNFIEQSAAQPGRGREVEYGFKIGMNFSNMNFNKGEPAPAEHIDPSWKAGILVGFLMNVPVAQRFSIQPEYYFSQAGGEWKGSGTTYKMSYLSLPVVFKYALAQKVLVIAGPQFDLLLNSKQKSANSILNVTHDTEERSFGATAGIEYRIAKQANINLRYIQGLNHVGIGQRSNIKEFKYELIQIAAHILL